MRSSDRTPISHQETDSYGGIELEDRTLRRIAIGLIAAGGALLLFAGAVILGFDTLLHRNGPSSVILIGAAIGFGWWGGLLCLVSGGLVFLYRGWRSG